jgi:hypothetical protein
MKLFIRCFGCKKKQKSIINKNVNNSSGINFSILVTNEAIISNQPNHEIKTKEDQIKEMQDKNVKNNSNNIENNNENKNNILISEETEEKNKNIKESLINEESEKDKDKDSNNIYSKLGLNLNEKIAFDDPLLKANSPLICNFEKEQKFTKKNLTELFNKYWVFDKFKKVWDKDNLIIEIRAEGTDINNEFSLIKISYKQLKSEFKDNSDLQTIVNFIYEQKLRILWDKVLKNIEIHEGDKTSNYILNTWVKSPVFFMSERDCLEKRFIYKNPNEKATYIMSSSIPEDIFPLKTDVVRITNYCNYYKIIDEGEYIGFHSLNQTDFKMPIPQFLVNATLPTTTKDWQNKLIQFSKEVTYDKTTFNVTYINKSDENK